MFRDDALKPLGKNAVTISYYDVNIHHAMIAGRSVALVLHFVSKNSVE